MKCMRQATAMVLGLCAAGVCATTGHAEEQWQDPNACYLQAATFNIATLQRLSFKDGENDYQTTLTAVAATLADDPCVVLHNLTDGATAIATATLLPTSLDTPIDLITFAKLGSNPYNVHVLAQYQPVRPSLLNCDVGTESLGDLDELRASIAQGQVTPVDGAQTAAVMLWHDACAIAHISPADILTTAGELADPANAAVTSADLVAKRFQR